MNEEKKVPFKWEYGEETISLQLGMYANNQRLYIGMLPDIDRSLFTYLGNTSLAGAYAMVRSERANEKVHEIASNMTYMELSTNPRYMDEFVAACFLPHTNRELFPSSVQE